MGKRTNTTLAMALFFSAVTLIALWAWTTTPDEPALKRYETNPYVVIGAPALVAGMAWIIYLYVRWRNRSH